MCRRLDRIPGCSMAGTLPGAAAGALADDADDCGRRERLRSPPRHRIALQDARRRRLDLKVVLSVSISHERLAGGNRLTFALEPRGNTCGRDVVGELRQEQSISMAHPSARRDGAVDPPTDAPRHQEWHQRPNRMPRYRSGRCPIGRRCSFPSGGESDVPYRSEPRHAADGRREW